MEKEALHHETHQKIFFAAGLFLKRDQGEAVSLIDALDTLNQIASEGDLNQVTDIYLYEDNYGDTEKALKDTVLHAITSIVAFEYQEKNFSYLKELILADHGQQSDGALDYLLKIGRYHEKFKNEVLTFVEKNLDAFSKNQLNVAAFYLIKLYKEEKRVTDLFQKIHILHDQKYRIAENIRDAWDEVDEDLKEIKIGKLFSEILEGKKVDSFAFSRYVYQEEFIEGVNLYKKHEHTAAEDQLDMFVHILTVLSDEMANLIHEFAKKAMDAGFHLSDLNQQFIVNPQTRTSLQELIDLLNTKNGKAVDIANLSSAKAKISTSISNLLTKEEIGEDMLQTAKSFENVGSPAVAIRLYESIMNDFQAESSKSTSGLFPEITYIDTRPEREIEIFETANAAHQKLLAQHNGQQTPQIDQEEDSTPAFEPSAQEIESSSVNAENSFFVRLKRMFKR